MNNLQLEAMHLARGSAKTNQSMKETCDFFQGVLLDEFMNISEHDMMEMYPEVMWYCDNDIMATKKALNEAFGVEADETAEEKKERERESYLKYKEFVMKKKGHKGGFR